MPSTSHPAPSHQEPSRAGMPGRLFAWTASRWYWGVGLLLLVGLRLMTLGAAPLFDPTDTRYANIAQQMILRQDWITPYIPAYHQPFLAKPPLTFWLTAGSYLVLGCNELSARLPCFLEGVVTLVFTFLIARHWFSLRTALLSMVLLASSVLFFIESGSVSMDMLVTMTVAGCLWAYLGVVASRRAKKNGRTLLYTLALGLLMGIGMLSKGPICWVLFLGPLGLYALAKRQWGVLWVPNWFLAALVALGVSLPWYLAAQQVNPDFLHYFFVQEHVYRYLKPDYGDRYGSGHHQLPGMSWLFLLGAFMPWSLLLPSIVYNYRKQFTFRLRQIAELPDSVLFLAAWALFAPLFFTLAKSILIAYLLSSVPPLAILCAVAIERWIERYSLCPVASADVSRKINRAFCPLLTTGLMLGLVWLVGLGMVVYFSFHYPVMTAFEKNISIIVLVLLLIKAGFALRMPASFRIPVFVMMTAVTGILLLSCLYSFLSDFIGRAKTMAVVLDALERREPTYRQREVVFWGEPAGPYSWYFYSQQNKVNELIRHPSGQPYIFPEPKLHRSLGPHETFLLIVTMPHLKSFKRDYPGYYVNTLIVRHGHFYIFDLAKSTPLPTNLKSVL